MNLFRRRHSHKIVLLLHPLNRLQNENSSVVYCVVNAYRGRTINVDDKSCICLRNICRIRFDSTFTVHVYNLCWINFWIKNRDYAIYSCGTKRKKKCWITVVYVHDNINSLLCWYRSLLMQYTVTNSCSTIFFYYYKCTWILFIFSTAHKCSPHFSFFILNPHKHTNVKKNLYAWNNIYLIIWSSDQSIKFNWICHKMEEKKFLSFK